MIKIEDKTGEIKETILYALRYLFDEKNTDDELALKLTEAALKIDSKDDVSLEMKADLQCQGLMKWD